MRLTKGETDLVLAIMAGHTTAKELAPILLVSQATIYGALHKIYGKSGAINMPQLVLMITGILPCPAVLLPVQKTWRRQHYKLDENSG